jgi:flagellar basal-body rod modification protein FlgD
MSVNGINDALGPVLGAPRATGTAAARMDFMELLVAQIRNQDPLSPLDNAEFTSQITQFTMLEELETMNAKLDENLVMGQSINNTAMLGLVGRRVTVEGNRTEVAGGAAGENMIAAAGPGTARIEVTDDTGHVVATYLREVEAGLNDVTWDGRLADGTTAADGAYTITVTVADASAAEVPFTTLMTGAVQGLRYENNMAVVMVGGLEFLVSEIYKVS